MRMGRMGMMNMQPNRQDMMGGGCMGMMNMQPNQPSGMPGGCMGMMMNMNSQMTTAVKSEGAKSQNGNSGAGMEGMDMKSDHTPAPASSGDSSSSQDQSMFRCPMHPTIMSTFPAKCPKCGMDLKKG